MERPPWVQLGLWGLKTRSSVLACFVISVVLAITLCAFGIWWGALLFVAAAWYWFAMRWVDKFDSW